MWRLLSTVISEVNNTKRGREGGVKKQLFGPHKHARSGGGGGGQRESYIAEIFFARKRTTDVQLTHSAGLFFLLRLQSER